jgi:4a-hydroxytetrahydrobiopterin dehydratase
MSNALASKKCIPCSGGTPPLEGQELKDLHTELNSDWHLEGEHHLEKEYTFDDFAQALEFTNKVGGLAEEQDHHPDIYLTYGKVRVKIWTHKIDGLTESDFVFAAKVEEIQAG